MSSTSSPTLMKSAVKGAIVFVADAYLLNLSHGNMQESLMFAGASAAAGYTAPMIASYLPFGAPSNLEQRVIEIAAGAATVFAFDKFILNQSFDIQNRTTQFRLLEHVAADFLGEMVNDFIAVSLHM